MQASHPFDRYRQCTALETLLAFSSRPLRKSIRVNTLKCAVEEFQAWARERGWQLTPVPWCKEGFFTEREDHAVALGKDLLHLIGHTYMQEAASMLPAALLDAQPGEVILDMAAAPGSKTTQIAAAMQSRGVIVANDVQEKRLWTLKSSLYRLGVTNAIVTKKVGQWFSRQMTERFDRVLCDAPCTAQGTVRKDTDALKYSSLDNIRKMASLQRELLESAVHATKVGGRIVYSTCTLTPEENEELVQSILNKFSTQLEVIDPRSEDVGLGDWDLGKAIADSERVQDALCPSPKVQSPFLRLWPQTYDTEGFFCAVLRKTAQTRDRLAMPRVHFQEEPLPRARQEEVGRIFKNRFGSSFLCEGDQLFQREDQILLATDGVANFSLPVEDYSLGLPYAVRLEGNRARIHHETATLRGGMATKNVLEITEGQLNELLDGKDFPIDSALTGDVILLCKKRPIGAGLAKQGILKNRLPRWIVRKS